MDEILGLLPNFPNWLAVPIILIALVIVIWPKIIQLIIDIATWNLFFERERKRLELLKLRYEIEAIKKTSQLEDLDVSYSKEAIAMPQESRAVAVSFGKRFLYGSLGSVLPMVIGFILVDYRAVFVNVTFWLILFYIIRLLILWSLAGLASAVLLREKQATPFSCILVGLSLTLLVQYLLAYNVIRTR